MVSLITADSSADMGIDRQTDRHADTTADARRRHQVLLTSPINVCRTNASIADDRFTDFNTRTGIPLLQYLYWPISY